MRPSLPRLRSLLKPFPDLAKPLLAAAQPAILLTPKPTPDTKVPRARSKFAGDPDLHPDTPWPKNKSGPFHFLAQINFAELAHLDPQGLLPNTGLASFFYSLEDTPWGFDPKDNRSFAVLYNKSPSSSRRRPRPPAKDQSLPPIDFNPCALTFSAITSIPATVAEADFDPDSLPDERLAQLLTKIWGPQGESNSDLHQVLGHPFPIQEPDLALQAAAASSGIDMGGMRPPPKAALARAKADAHNWILLLQLDSDDRPSWSWADTGILYFFIHKRDLAKRDFSKCWCILQCA